MKKSEMIKIMQNAWKIYLLNAISPDELNTRQGMEYVLDSMIDSGMVPPYNEPSFDLPSGTFDHRGILSNYKWEAEND